MKPFINALPKTKRTQPQASSYAPSAFEVPFVHRSLFVLVQVLVWGYIFTSPLLFRRFDEPLHWVRFVPECFASFTSFLLFYLNYFVLIPRYVFRRGRLLTFVAINVVLCLLCVGVHEMVISMHMLGRVEGVRPRLRPSALMRAAFMMRGFLTFCSVVGASVALRLSLEWRKSEQARAVAELQRTEAELKQIKNQINPHFLLNTLNNIYALCALDADKAQHAVHELARMFRYVLYDHPSDLVDLAVEADFLRSYVNLMKLRLAGNVDVQVDISMPTKHPVRVAPMLFISLAENAFKHGVSPTNPSFVHITLQTDGTELLFRCTNSNYPKAHGDKSPGGIGLQLTQQRLDLTYARRYTWKKGPSDDGTVYTSELRIML